ncbi:MAG: Chemotaxis regulator - transmits chemoreceptor signals to flagellar motor components CheY [uncultured Caballeronia sp.]|nr:MAG: Chemotaxis regulator - transmits chemoreceptor signals to flagellar motor components CheY [uncultured Caballeronia sp.]
MIKNILAIDDSAAMRQILSATFVAAGYRVVAMDGAEAYEAALAEQFDLVITDQNMPAMSDLELIGKLREHRAYANTPILVLTTESGEPFKAAARAVGATGWIEKPFDPDVLTDLVARLSEAEHPH